MTDLDIKVKAILEWLAERKADAISLYDVRALNIYTDYIIICEGQADLHVRAIANNLLDNAKLHKQTVLSKEGIEYGRWALVDMGDIVVHIFLPEIRKFYKLDELIASYLQKTEKAEHAHD